jgi:hypothetical protein
MKKKYASICAAISMLLVVSVGSVIGTEHITESSTQITESPLFSIQTTRFTKSQINRGGSTFIGKDSESASFGFTLQTLNSQLDQVITLLRKHPQVLSTLLPRLCQHEAIKPILKENNIELRDIQKEINLFQQNPLLLEEIINKQLKDSSIQNPSTLGLNSSNPLAILIVVFALLPLLVTLVLIIATVTIITCLNVGGCFEAIFYGIVYGFINGLEPA